MSSLQAFDTNYVLALTDPRDEARLKAEAALDRTLETVVPSVVYGEAWYGLTLGKPDRTAKKRKIFERRIIPLRILWADHETLKRFHDLAWSLARQGKPIQSNDVWIAALCLQNDAILITDDSDFKRVPGLKTRSW